MEFSVEYIKPIEGISSSPFPKHWAFSPQNRSPRPGRDVLDLSKHAISPDQAIHIVFERVLNEINNLLLSRRRGIRIPIEAVNDQNPIVLGHLIAERSMQVFEIVFPDQKQVLKLLPGTIHKGIVNATTILDELDALTPDIELAIDTIEHTALMRLNELNTGNVLPLTA